MLVPGVLFSGDRVLVASEESGSQVSFINQGFAFAEDGSLFLDGGAPAGDIYYKGFRLNPDSGAVHVTTTTAGSDVFHEGLRRSAIGQLVVDESGPVVAFASGNPVTAAGALAVELTAGFGGGAGDDGEVGSYANLDLALYPRYSVDMGLNDYSSHYNAQNGGAGTGSTTHNATGWWDGGAFARIIPPTVDGLERGIELLDLYQGGTLPIQKIQFRWEQRFGGEVASLLDGTGGVHPPVNGGPKFLLLHARHTLSVGDAEDRPALFVSPTTSCDNPAHNRANTLSMCPASETTQGWGPSVYDDTYIFADPTPGTLSYYVNGIQGCYFTDTGDTGTHQGKPLIDAGDFITIVFRVITVATTVDGQSRPRGLIAYRVYLRDGTYFERGIPYNWGEDFVLGSYITELQQFGCGQWNIAPTPDANMYFDVGGYITVDIETDDWLEPRAGFVQA